ncbi:MAG: hypothetical protein CMR00_11315 [[Chlorobium] sp. 445]|nr:MAG: hypothetical protein CMR00_11315 [[Chlorobium] sp. 445]
MNLHKHLLLFFATLLPFFLCAAALPLTAQESAETFTYRKVANNSFRTGERLQYHLKYGFIKAANTEIAIVKDTVIRGEPCYHVVFTANTLPVFDNFFKVDDRYETFIHKDAMCPLYFKQRLREGKFSRDDEVEFFHHTGRARSIVHNKEFPMNAYAQDILSAYFYVRTLNLRSFKNGESIHLKQISDDKEYPLEVKVRYRDVIETEVGTFNTVVVEPLVQGAGLFKSEGRILIWMTDDDNKIPVKISIKVPVGAITAEIASMEGILHPLTAKRKE